MKVTVWSWGDLPGIGQYAAKLLRLLGYPTTIKTRSGYGSLPDRQRLTHQSPDRYDRMDLRLPGRVRLLRRHPDVRIRSCPATRETRTRPSSAIPSIDRQIDRALNEQALDPDAARGLWQRIDRQTVDQAPWVALVNPKSVEVLSKRTGNYQSEPQLGVLIDQLWTR